MRIGLKLWTERKHGEVGYYQTQFLTGHGYFKSFLRKIGKSLESQCIYCLAEEDNAYHTFFACARWDNARIDLIEKIGGFNPEDITDKMLGSPEIWNDVATFVHIVTDKEENREWEGGIWS